MKRGTLWRHQKNFRKKAEITCTKKLVNCETRTQVLLLGRPRKILKKSEAKEGTLVWQLVEASL